MQDVRFLFLPGLSKTVIHIFFRARSAQILSYAPTFPHFPQFSPKSAIFPSSKHREQAFCRN